MNKMNHEAVARRNPALLLGIGWICALLSLLFFPFIFGVVAVVLGVLATKNGSRNGLNLIVASILFMGTGLMFNQTLLNYVRQWFGL